MGEAVTARQLLKVTAIFLMAELQELPQQYCLRKQEPAKLVIFTGADWNMDQPQEGQRINKNRCIYQNSAISRPAGSEKLTDQMWI